MPKIPKTLIIILIFIVVTILISIAFSLFFAPKIRYEDCILLQNTETKEIDCFGCFNNICKDANADWKAYISTGGDIQFSCLKTTEGCQLAQ